MKYQTESERDDRDRLEDIKREKKLREQRSADHIQITISEKEHGGEQ